MGKNFRNCSLSTLYFDLAQLLGVITPVPKMNLRVRITGLGGFEFAEFRQLRVNLGLQTVAKFFLKRNRRGGVLRHLHFQLVIRPVRVAELGGDFIAQRQELAHERTVFRLASWSRAVSTCLRTASLFTCSSTAMYCQVTFTWMLYSSSPVFTPGR